MAKDSITVKVLRPFWLGGVHGSKVAKGEIRAFPVLFARELIGNGKAEETNESPAKAAPEVDKTPAQAGKAKK